MQGGPCASVGAPGTTGGDAISILGGGGITAPPGGGASFDPKALAAAAAAAATAATGLVGVPSAPLGTFPGEDEDVGMLLLKEPNADCTGNVFENCSARSGKVADNTVKSNLNELLSHLKYC